MRAAFEAAFRGVTDRARACPRLPGTGGSPPGEPASDAVLAGVIATADALPGADEPFLVASWPSGRIRSFGEDPALICERPASFVRGRRDRIAGYRNV